MLTRPTSQDLHANFPWYLQPSSFQITLSWQAPDVVDIMHNTKLCWKFRYLLLSFNILHYHLQYIIRPLPKRSNGHLHHTLVIRFRLLPLVGQVCIDRKAILLLEVLVFAGYPGKNTPGPASEWVGIDFLTIILWADVSKAKSVFNQSSRNVCVTCHTDGKDGCVGTFWTIFHPCIHFKGNVLYGQVTSEQRQVQAA